MEGGEVALKRTEARFDACEDAVFLASSLHTLLGSGALGSRVDVYAKHMKGVERIDADPLGLRLDFVRAICRLPALERVSAHADAPSLTVELPISGKAGITWDAHAVSGRQVEDVRRAIERLDGSRTGIVQTGSALSLEVGRSNVRFAKARRNPREGCLEREVEVFDGSVALLATQAAIEDEVARMKGKEGLAVQLLLGFDAMPASEADQVMWQDWSESYLELACSSDSSFETQSCLHARYDYAIARNAKAISEKLYAICTSPGVDARRIIVNTSSPGHGRQGARLEGGFSGASARRIAFELRGRGPVVRAGMIGVYEGMRFQAHLLVRQRLISIVTPKGAPQQKVLSLCLAMAKNADI